MPFISFSMSDGFFLFCQWMPSRKISICLVYLTPLYRKKKHNACNVAAIISYELDWLATTTTTTKICVLKHFHHSLVFYYMFCVCIKNYNIIAWNRICAITFTMKITSTQHTQTHTIQYTTRQLKDEWGKNKQLLIKWSIFAIHLFKIYIFCINNS